MASDMAGQGGKDNNVENDFGSDFEGYSQFPEDDGYFGVKKLGGKGKKFNEQDQGFYSGGHDDFGFDGVNFGDKPAKKLNKKNIQFQSKDEDFNSQSQGQEDFSFGGVNFGGKKSAQKLNKKNQFESKDESFNSQGQDSDISFDGVNFGGKKLETNDRRGDDFQSGDDSRQGDDFGSRSDGDEEHFGRRRGGKKAMKRLNKGKGKKNVGNNAQDSVFPGGENANWDKVPYEEIAPFVEKKMAMGDIKPDDYQIANSNLGDLDFNKYLYPGVEDVKNHDFKGDGNDFDSAYLPDYDDYDHILEKQDQVGEAEPLGENMAQAEPQPMPKKMKKLVKKNKGKKAKQGLRKFW